MPLNFADRLMEAVRSKGSPLCVGLDPVYERLPEQLRRGRDGTDAEAAFSAVLEFCRRVIRVVAPWVPVVKINAAFFERYYGRGVDGYFSLVKEAADQGLLVIGDVKRSDIGHSAEQYARACLAAPPFAGMQDRPSPDAITVNPYLGWDGIKPFVDIAASQHKGLFALVRTSNPSAGEFQHLVTSDGATLADHVATRLAAWASADELVGESGYSSMGAVVSTEDPGEAARIRRILDRSLFLIPGYGAQGMGIEAVARLFKPDGTGAVVNASRSIVFAYQTSGDPDDWEAAVEHACRNAISELKLNLPSARP